ncbi:Hypothetical predicted protein [Paramuricea clavata]|uniref:Uncharacterized protein n=1 Tax=Paramuricea clavata TaxID=317549 RepID=A0A7D9JL15_PARCT|nr:Hypothetical predicted protein [Paramuricea clavata]
MAESMLPPPTKFNIEATDAYIEWKAWIESFNIYAVAVELEKKKESFKEAVEALEGYFTPRRNVIAERHKFRSRKQNADETIDAYLTSLRELVKTCEFGALEDEMLRDHIVEKCYSKQLRERLLAQEELDLAKTLRIARSSESAIKERRKCIETSVQFDAKIQIVMNRVLKANPKTNRFCSWKGKTVLSRLQSMVAR